MNRTAQTLLDHLRARQEEMTALLRDLALIESPSLDPATQEPVFARFAAGTRPRSLPCALQPVPHP